MAKSEQVIKDLDRVIGLINTDMKDIPAEEKKNRWWQIPSIILTTT